jgi:hypothetical protein
MLIGYARASTDNQDTAAQVASLKAAGCERMYREKASGGRWDRPELHRLLDHLRKGDVLVVWKLDRLSRSLRDVLTIMERLAEAKAGVPQLDRGDRHHYSGRPHDDADGRGVCGIRAGHAQRADQGRAGCCPAGRAHWRTAPKAVASTAS